MSTSDHPSTGDLPGEPSGPPALEARIEQYEGAPDECTLTPREATDDERITRWITATEGSFVGLPEMR